MSLGTQFEARLARRIEETANETVSAITGGSLTYDEYKRRTGYLKALEDVSVWCEEISKAINEGK